MIAWTAHKYICNVHSSISFLLLLHNALYLVRLELLFPSMAIHKKNRGILTVLLLKVLLHVLLTACLDFRLVCLPRSSYLLERLLYQKRNILLQPVGHLFLFLQNLHTYIGSLLVA